MKEFIRFFGGFLLRDVAYTINGSFVMFATGFVAGFGLQDLKDLSIFLLLLLLGWSWVVGFVLQMIGALFRIVEVRRPMPGNVAKICYRVWERESWDGKQVDPNFDPDKYEAQLFRERHGKEISEYQRVIFLKEMCADGAVCLIASALILTFFGETKYWLIIASCATAALVMAPMSRAFAAIQVVQLYQFATNPEEGSARSEAIAQQEHSADQRTAGR